MIAYKLKPSAPGDPGRFAIATCPCGLLLGLRAVRDGGADRTPPRGPAKPRGASLMSEWLPGLDAQAATRIERLAP